MSADTPEQASKQASFFCNTTRRDRLKTTRFLENYGQAQRDRLRTTDGKFLLIPRCRDRDPGGPPQPTEKNCTFTLLVPNGRGAMYGKSKIFELLVVSQPPLHRFCETSHTATGLIFGLQFLQHHETRPTWNSTVSGTVLPHESTWFPT